MINSLREELLQVPPAFCFPDKIKNFPAAEIFGQRDIENEKEAL